MHVAGHALARWNRARERVPDRMTRLGARRVYRGIDGLRLSVVPILRVLHRVFGRSVVRVDHVAGRAAAAAIIAGLIVRTRKGEERIEQPRLLESEEDGIGSNLGAEASIAQLDRSEEHTSELQS